MAVYFLESMFLESENKGKQSICKSRKEGATVQPGLEVKSSAYATDALPLDLLGPEHIQISSVPPSHNFTSASQHKPHRKAHLTISAPTGPSRRHCASRTFTNALIPLLFRFNLSLFLQFLSKLCPCDMHNGDATIPWERI